ncbi:MAG: Na+/H+ antiporter subunit D [Lentimicrobium sp.]|jgi:multicomponent Na+:H+ antiporter subunit D|nr:Na+/H+ antiporter subunit D [Lentimicrobium sp.]
MILPALPILLPLITLIFLLLNFKNREWQPWIGLTGALLQLALAIIIAVQVNNHGIMVLHTGNWQAPFGITLVVDAFSSIMLILAGIIAVSISIYSIDAVDRQRQSYFYFPMVHGLLMGVNGAFVTGDIFNLYVWFEVMLMASFVLITLGGEKKQLSGAVKYVTLNLVSSLFFLAGIGLLYGKMGSLNMADLALKLSMDEQNILLNTSAALFFVAFSIKAAVFPFFFWLPASYHTPPIAITALFAGLLTKVGVYSLIRFYTLFFVQDKLFWHPLFLWIGGFTMVVGALTAASQYDIRKILSFHIISQIGYMIMGLGIFTVVGIAGAIFYMAHNIIAKTNTFLVAGLINRVTGSYDLKTIGGLYKYRPWLAILFIIPAFGLAGIPPLSGFFGKLILISAGFSAGEYVISSIALAVGLFTLFSMVKIWNEAFWKPKPQNSPAFDGETEKLPVSMVIPAAFLGLLTLTMGFAVKPILDFAMIAAAQLMDPAAYISAVLGMPQLTP